MIGAVVVGCILYAWWPDNTLREAPIPSDTPATYQPSIATLGESEPEEGSRPGVESSVSGVVVDTHGEPIEGAIVSVEPVEDATEAIRNVSLRTSNTSVTSGSDGLFYLTLPLAEKEMTFAVWCKGYLASKESVFVPNGGINDLCFVLKRPASIDGYVVNSRLRPLPHMIVGAVDEAFRSSEALSPTRADGAFLLEGLPPGEYRIYCRYVPPGRPRQYHRGLPIGNVPLCPDQALLNVSLEEGEKLSSLRVVVPWDPDRNIQGTVQDEAGRAITDAFTWVELTAATNFPIQLAEKRTDAAGLFSIECIPYGGEDLCMPPIDTVTVVAEADGYETARLESIPVGSHDLVITLPVAQYGRIRGMLVDAATSEPIATAKILLLGVESNMGGTWSAGTIAWLLKKRGGEVSPDGTFLFDNVRPGNGDLIAFAPHYGLSKHVVTVEPGETSDMTITLMRAGKLQLTTKYVGELYGRMAECVIECRPVGDQGSASVITPEMSQDMQELHRQSPQAVGEGAYDLELQPGDYEVVVGTRILLEEDVSRPLSKNYQGFCVSIQSDQTTSIEVPVGGSGSVVGTVVGGTGTRMRGYLVAGSDVSLLSETHDHRTLAIEYGAVMIARIFDGIFETRAVPAGVYTLAILQEAPDGNTLILASENFAVGDNESVSLEFNFKD